MKKNKVLYGAAFLLTIGLIFSGCGGLPGPAGQGGASGRNTVTILSVNDFHGNLAQSGSTADSPQNPGAAKMSGAVKALVAQNPATTVVVSGGDNYQGSAVSNLNFGKPVSDTFRAMGVRLSAVGNHEFDWLKPNGEYYFKDWAEDGNFTFLAANITDKTTNQLADFAKPYEILNIDGHKIGVIGITTLETPSIVVAGNISNLQFENAEAVTRKYYEELKTTCDAVIVLGHIGSGGGYQTSITTVTGEAAGLAQAVPELTAIISGHSHTRVNGIAHGVPVIQAGNAGRYIARVDIHFDEKTGKVSGVDTSTVDICSTYAIRTNAPVDWKVANLLAKYTEDLKGILNEEVGRHQTGLTSSDAVAEWWCKEISNYLLRTEGKQYFITQNDGGLRSPFKNDLPTTITMEYMYGLMPFDNMLTTMQMTGADIIAFMDNPFLASASSRGTLRSYGVVKQPNNSYIWQYDNTPINPTAIYNVMTNDFMFTGGDGFNFTKGTNVQQGTDIRDAVVRQLKFEAGL